MKKIIPWLLVISLALSAFLPAGAEQLGEKEYPGLYEAAAVSALMPVFDSVGEVTAKTVPLYLGRLDQVSQITLYFMNGCMDVPFVNAEEIAPLLESVINTPNDNGVRCTNSILGSCLIITRENGASAMIDFTDQTITVDELNRFYAPAGEYYGIDAARDIKPTGSDAYSFLNKTAVYVRSGSQTVFRLGDYHIPMPLVEHTGYLPLATVSDLFFSDNYINLAYNGVNAFALEYGTVDVYEKDVENTMSHLYFDCPKGEKSEQLARMTYNELCMVLDRFYGLKEEHHVDSFDRLFIETGIVDRLLNTDPAKTYEGLSELTMGFFRDGHSAVTVPSHLTDGFENSAETMNYVMMSAMKSLLNMITWQNARDRFYPDGVPGYEEVEDTAYITFDSFLRDPERLYREGDITNNPLDTLELILYANEQIHRENSPVRNVVLDLTMNGGGMADTALYTVCWLLGSTPITILDTADGTESTLIYDFDADRSGSFMDAEDSLDPMTNRVYCLISPISFSCGNLVPSVLKDSGRATLIGQTSGGGACAVLPLITADGALIAISGHSRISYVKNGIFYSVDEGITPDVFVNDPAHLYDRQYLTNLIRQLP